MIAPGGRAKNFALDMLNESGEIQVDGSVGSSNRGT
jgi:hypothetical protein